MDFVARMRKRQQESSSCITTTCQSKDVEISGKKAKRDFGSQSSQSVEYDEIELIASEPPSPVLLEMETDVLNKSSTPSRSSSNASIENAAGKKWTIPKDVKIYRHTRQTIDPFIEDQDSSEKPLIDKRANRSDPVGYVPLYPRKGCTPTTADNNRLVNEFAKVLDLVHRCQRRSLTYREWRKPANASSGSLNRKKDAAADEQPTSFAGRINNRLRAETVTNNSDEENEENALIPYLPPDDAEVPVSQGDSAHNRTFTEEPQSQSDFTLQIDSNSDEDFIPVSKKSRNRRGKNKNKGADTKQQQQPNRQTRDRGPNDRVANDDKKRLEASQRFLRSRPPSDYSVHTPSAGRKLMSRFQEPESDDLQIDDSFVLKSNNIGFRKHNPRTYSLVTAGSSKGDVDEERRPATRNRLALARQPIRRLDVGGAENEHAASPNRRRSSPEIQHQSLVNDDDKVQCPLCRRMFAANVIEEHASDCPGEAEDDSTRCEADKQKCYVCCENISLSLYSTHVKQCIEKRLAKSDSQAISDDVEMKQVENSTNHIVPPTEIHVLDEVAAVPVVNQENLIRNGSSAAADLATFVPIRQLSVKLFDFNQQFASSRPNNVTKKRKVTGGKKRKWKKKNRWQKKKKK